MDWKRIKPETLIRYYVISIISIYLCISLLRIDTSWDFLSYHLPFALRKFGLTTFDPDDFLIAFEAGHPGLAHWLQGFFVYLTGYYPLANSLGIFAFLGLLIFLRKSSPSFRWEYFLFFSMAVPLIQTHLPIGNIDLFNGCLLAASIYGLKKYESQKGRPFLIMSLALLGLAANVKFQAWIPCAFFSLYAVFIVSKKHDFFKPFVLIAFIFSAGLQVYPLADNFMKFGNPSYPFETSLFKNNDGYSAKEVETFSHEMQIPEKFHSLPRQLLFFTSLFEIDRILFPDFGFRYWYDMSHKDKNQSPHYRMGGFGIVTFFLLIILTIKWGNGLTRKYLFLLLGSTLLISNIPHSNEMRYWLFIPLTLCILSTESVPRISWPIAGFLLVFSLHVFFYTRPWKNFYLQPEFWSAKTSLPNGCDLNDGLVLRTNNFPEGILMTGPYFNGCKIKIIRK